MAAPPKRQAEKVCTKIERASYTQRSAAGGVAASVNTVARTLLRLN